MSDNKRSIRVNRKHLFLYIANALWLTVMYAGTFAYAVLELKTSLVWLAGVPLIIILALELSNYPSTVSLENAVSLVFGPLTFIVSVFILKETLIQTAYLMTASHFIFFYEGLAMLTLFQRPNKRDLLPVFMSTGLVVCVFFGLSFHKGFFDFEANSAIEWGLKGSALLPMVFGIRRILKTGELAIMPDRDSQFLPEGKVIPGTIIVIMLFLLFGLGNLIRRKPEWLLSL